MKESKAMMRKEVSFMKKKGAPKSMIKHEEAEMEGKKMPKFAAGGMGLQKRQFGTGPGQKPMPKHLGKAVTDRGKAIMAPPTPKFAAGGTSAIKGRPGGAYEALQAKQAATRAREAAFRQANSVEARAAAQRAARAAPRPPAPAPAGGAAVPTSGMGGAGGTQAMMRKGGMAGSYRKAADGAAHKGKTKGTMVKMREGGSVFRKSADGIASKGKTKGTMVKMAYGGKC